MCDIMLRLQVVLVVLSLAIKGFFAVDDSILFSVTRAPRYLGVLQDHRGQPMSVELSDDYMDQDYLASNGKHHKAEKNTLDVDDFEDDESEEQVNEEKDKDVRLPNLNKVLKALPL